MRIRIRCLGIIHPGHGRPNSGIFWLGFGDAHRGANPDQREKLRRGFTMEPDTAMSAWVWVHKALMKTVGGRKFTPETHRISNITPRNIRVRVRGHDAFAL